MKNFSLILCFMLLGQATAQQNFSLYPMRRIPQANLLNPGIAPDSKWHLGIPVLNSNYMQYSNGGFNLNKIFDITEPINGDSLAINLNKMVDLLSKKNYISLKTEVSWLSAGLKFQKHYFHFNVVEKAAFRLSLPKDLFRFIIDGNGGANLGETFEFRFKADVIHYREYAAGYNYQLSENLSFGGRLKYIKGFSCINTQNLGLDITTDKEDFSYLLKSNVKINAASVLGDIVITDSTQSNPDFSPSMLFRSPNNGLGLDLGAQYKFGDNLTFSASLLDLGFIRWKSNATTIQSRNPNAEYKFDGIHISGSDTNSDFEQYLGEIADSLLTTFGIDTVQRSFTTALSTEFFIGASYQFNKKMDFGALFYGDFYNRRFYPGLTLNFLWKPLNMLHLNFTNTIYNRGWINPGIACSVNAGAVQFYGVMDNFLFPFAFASMKSFSIRGGMNLTFGREGVKKKNKDKHGIDEAIPDTTPAPL